MTITAHPLPIEEAVAEVVDVEVVEEEEAVGGGVKATIPVVSRTLMIRWNHHANVVAHRLVVVEGVTTTMMAAVEEEVTAMEEDAVDLVVEKRRRHLGLRVLTRDPVPNNLHSRMVTRERMRIPYRKPFVLVSPNN